MRLAKICNDFKVYLGRDDVKGVCESKIYKGLRKIEAEFRAITTKDGITSESLDEFYSKAPANIKLFKTANLSKALNSFNFSYEGLGDSTKKLDIYNKALFFLTVVRLTEFWVSVLSSNPQATVATTGVTKSVFSRAQMIQDIVDLGEAEMKSKSPDRASILYIEMGLKRIISMEVGTDDWDK